MTKVAVILSGCGHLDGAEIRESVLTLLYLDQQGADVELFAPNAPQSDVVDHLKGNPTGESRNMLTEAARIARGRIRDMAQLNASDFDALLIPGGFGVAKNLCDLAQKGIEAKVNPEAERVVKAFFEADKPIGAICIAPALLALILRDKGLTLTIGEDEDTAQLIGSLGHTHVECSSESAVVDHVHRIATCSAYMRDDRLSPIASGIEKVVYETLAMIGS